MRVATRLLVKLSFLISTGGTISSSVCINYSMMATANMKVAHFAVPVRPSPRSASRRCCTARSSTAGVSLTTERDCQLAVSIYPTFAYDASGGGGTGTATTTTDTTQHIVFDPATLRIPPLDYRSTRLFGIPLPPPLKIDIVPRALQGEVNTATGQARLSFDAEFCFSIGALYKAPPLSVVTDLTTETSSGSIHTAEGQRRSPDGTCRCGGCRLLHCCCVRSHTFRLVGVARVPTTSDPLLNTFLMLPTDALAVLSATLTFDEPA